MSNYTSLSIETHLFFARIMKEHSLFLAAGFPCKDKDWIQKAEWFFMQFENLLSDAVRLGDQNVGSCILKSDELVTEFTVPAERRTEKLSGVPINSRISIMEKSLRPGNFQEENRDFVRRVEQLNLHAVELLDGLIALKEAVLAEVSRGELFTANYPLLIEHIIREAKLYRSTILELLRNRNLSRQNMRETEIFWNQIMMEHAMFIRGLLDPSEETLIDTADEFADDYAKLLQLAKTQDALASSELTQKTLEETLKYREFKAAGAKGILDLKVASIILPLLADHVLREANHYIRILSCR